MGNPSPPTAPPTVADSAPTPGEQLAAQTPNHPMGDTAPGWLTFCPHWCTSEHRPGEHPDDRQHTGVYYYTPLQTMDYVDYGTPGAPDWMPRDLMVALVQEYREVEPRALVMETADDVALYLTLGEARRLRTHLDELLADADGDPAPTGVVQAAQDVLADARADNVHRGEAAAPPLSCEAGPLASVALVGGAR